MASKFKFSAITSNKDAPASSPRALLTLLIFIFLASLVSFQIGILHKHTVLKPPPCKDIIDRYNAYIAAAVSPTVCNETLASMITDVNVNGTSADSNIFKFAPPSSYHNLTSSSSPYNATLLHKLFEYEPKLDNKALQRGVYSYGDLGRLRRVLHKVLTANAHSEGTDDDETVFIAGLGTSIMAGAGADRGRGLLPEDKTAAFFTVVENWLNGAVDNNEQSKKTKLKFFNGAVGATSSVMHDACFQNLIPEDIDLLILEESTHWDIGLTTPGPLHWQQENLGNNGTFARETRLSFERLLRKALSLKNKPAVIIIHSYSWYRTGGKYHTAIENDYNVLAQYYGIPALSVRAAAYHYMQQNKTGFRIDHLSSSTNSSLVPHKELFYHDEIHPAGHTGHRYMADLIVRLLQSTVSSLVVDPYREGEEDAEYGSERGGGVDEVVNGVGDGVEKTKDAKVLPSSILSSLPPPLVPGNYEMNRACLLNEAMKTSAIDKRGFEWVSERPEAKSVNDQKWGYIATEPGSVITFSFDTRTSAAAASNSKSTTTTNNATNATTTANDNNNDLPKSMLALQHLKSYQHMGSFSLECIANCTCTNTTVNSHWQQKISVPESHSIQVTQHENCIMKVTVLNETSSGEHKVKIVGVIVMGMRLGWLPRTLGG